MSFVNFTRPFRGSYTPRQVCDGGNGVPTADFFCLGGEEDVSVPGTTSNERLVTSLRSPRTQSRSRTLSTDYSDIVFIPPLRSHGRSLTVRVVAR